MAADPEALLCLASHARRPVTSLVLGSVSEKVVRASRHAVLVIGPHCSAPPDRYDSMIVALDGSPSPSASCPPSPTGRPASTWSRGCSRCCRPTSSTTSTPPICAARAPM
jgi:hypothetical protein